MNHDQARRIIVGALTTVAPEVDLDDVGDDDEFAARLDLDSMDYLNWILEIHRASGIDIPERDYDRLATLGATAQYLVEASARQ